MKLDIGKPRENTYFKVSRSEMCPVCYSARTSWGKPAAAGREGPAQRDLADNVVRPSAHTQAFCSGRRGPQGSPLTVSTPAPSRHVCSEVPMNVASFGGSDLALPKHSNECRVLRGGSELPPAIEPYRCFYPGSICVSLTRLMSYQTLCRISHERVASGRFALLQLCWPTFRSGDSPSSCPPHSQHVTLGFLSAWNPFSHLYYGLLLVNQFPAQILPSWRGFCVHSLPSPCLSLPEH